MSGLGLFLRPALRREDAGLAADVQSGDVTLEQVQLALHSREVSLQVVEVRVRLVEAPLCTDRTDLASTCEYSPRYACFGAAGCARQANGACGFNQTQALTDCLARVADGGAP